MILATPRGNREVRFGINTAMPPSRWSGYWTPSGETVTSDKAVGLSPIGRGHRMVCGVIGSLPLLVWQGTGGEKREMPDTPQGRLLANPVAGMSVFDWKWDVASALEVHENAFLLKVRAGDGRVVELLPIPSEYVYGDTDDQGNKRFHVHTPQGRAILTAIDVLHIRGQTVDGGPFGVSRVMQHSDPVGAMLAAQKFEGSYFRNHARPDMAVIFPQGVTKDQAAQWRDEWESRYAGAGNAGKVVPLGGGATIQPIPVSMKESQHLELRQFSVDEAARIVDLDPVLLGKEADADTRRAALELFLKLDLPPRLCRITDAFRADMDLFTLGDTLYPEFRVDDLMFADPLTRAQVQHYRVQDGTELVDEARASNGRPPLPDGMGQIPQITPVGGAPNPTIEAPDESERSVSVPAITLQVEQDMGPLADVLARQAVMNGAVLAGIEQTNRTLVDASRRRETRDTMLDERRKQRDTEMVEALRQVGSPQVVVNVDPTPIEVNVSAVPVQLSLEMPQTQREVTFSRDQNGRIVGAEVTDS